MDSILQTVQTARNKAPHVDRPFILLTWVQSLDGMLASAPDTRTLISGPCSMQLTHALRAMHDVILVGINTVLSDDPRLSSRMNEDTASILSRVAPERGASNPTPVVLDSRLRTPLTARLFETERPHKPIIFTSDQNGKTCPNSIALRAHAMILGVETNDALVVQSAERLALLLKKLLQLGVTSIMVEGGASVLSSFLDAGLYDMIITTVSPNLFGQGVHLCANSPARSFALRYINNPTWVQLGDDAVVVGYR